jgi:uncharacterized protein (DUF1778 family)
MKAMSGDRVDLRVPAPVKERLRKVAALSGRSMSDFIVAAALEKAEEVNASIERWELDAEDSRIVMDALMNSRDIPGLRALFTEAATKKASDPIEA